MSIDSDYETWTGADWSLTINGNDYTSNFTLAEFRERLNEPLQFNLKVEGVDADNTDIDKNNEVRFKFDGEKAFKGIITKDKFSSDLTAEPEGYGMAFKLRDKGRDYSNQWTSADTTTIVNDIVTQGASNVLQVGTNTSLNASADFRVDDESKKQALNRLANEHGGEWWVDEDGSNNDQFNMDTQRGGGNPVKTFVTQGEFENAATSGKEESSVEGDFDGIKVKGYGDGDDQITATAGTTGPDKDVLIVVDKTIETSSQAQNKADTLNSKHGGAWLQVEVEPANPNQILDIGEVVSILSDDADLRQTFTVTSVDTSTDVVSVSGDQTSTFTTNDVIKIEGSTGNDGDYQVDGVSYDGTDDETDLTLAQNVGDSTADGDVVRGEDYRIVERYYQIDNQGGVDAKFVCNNKPRTFFNDAKEAKSETKSQTQYMQGQRNTINESNSEISDSSNGTVIELNIPKRFTEDVTGKDRTEAVYVDYDVDDYKQLISASDVTGIDDSTKLVDTTVTNFGDVDRVQTERKPEGDADETLADFTVTDVTNAGGASEVTAVENSITASNYTGGSVQTVDSIDVGSSDTAGIFVQVAFSVLPTQSNFAGESTVIKNGIQLRNNDDLGTHPSTSATGIVATTKHVAVAEDDTSDGTASIRWTPDSNSVLIFFPENTGNVNASPEFDVEYEPSEDVNAEFEITWWTIGQHKHNMPNTSDAADNVQAYTEVKGGGDIDAGQNADQDDESLPDTGTITFGQLDNNDLVLTKKTTNASSVTVKVNGTEVSGSPFSSLQKSDIDVTPQINSPGFNKVEIIPDAKGFVKANAVVDHKLDANR